MTLFYPHARDAIMITRREFAWLHTLQMSLAVKRDWVAVAHLQALIDHLAEKHIQPDQTVPQPEAGIQIH
jgi:hypothetical protein